MIFYTHHVLAALVFIGFLLMASVYRGYIRKNTESELFLLLLTGLALRLLMASVDPFLQDWDERFHALVAKNLINHPLQPMLRVSPIMPYKMENWCCNHIWVHKQPLFLWQMALSMTIFGINEIAIRLPSVIMGAINIYFIYDIAKKWTQDTKVAYLAALLFTVSYYQLELTSGNFALDQNDLTFAFYVTAGIWAFVRYLHDKKQAYFWSILVGVFVGCAVLNKWLTGVLVFGTWGLYELLASNRKFDFETWKPLILSVLTSLLVFVPWQLYILKNYPLESSLMYEHNRRHIFEVLDNHHGSIWFHLNQMRTTYGQLLLVFLPIGVYSILSNKLLNHKLSISLLATVVIIYSFFSFVVQTKMPAFTFPVNALIWTVIAAGIIFGYKFLFKKEPAFVLMFLVFILVF